MPENGLKNLNSKIVQTIGFIDGYTPMYFAWFSMFL